MKEVRLSHNEEKIVRVLNEGMASPKELAALLGNGFTELKIQSMVLTLARKGQIDKVKAALLLRGTPMVKFLNYGVGSRLEGNMPAQKMR